MVVVTISADESIIIVVCNFRLKRKSTFASVFSTAICKWRAIVIVDGIACRLVGVSIQTAIILVIVARLRSIQLGYILLTGAEAHLSFLIY